MAIVSTILGLASLVLGILVLIKLFQKEGALKGILGLICMLYTFIWGWMKTKENDNRNIMIFWTVAIVLTVIANVIASSQAMSAVSQ
jgi:uncharacterized membrane protein YphA (DoxX/SURF4 family)